MQTKENVSMKTTLDWYQEIPCPIVRRRAIRNCTRPNVKEVSIDEAILGGFYWNKTSEGIEYWGRVYSNPLAPSPEHLLPDGYREEEEQEPIPTPFNEALVLLQ